MVAKPEASKVQTNITITDADCLGLTGISDEQWKIVHKLINKETHLKSIYRVRKMNVCGS